MADHRSCPRWQISWQAKAKLESKEELTDCCISDINLKGLKISLRESLDVDSFVNLSIVLSEDFVVQIQAWVTWHKNIEGFNVYGLYFNKIKDADREKIYQFLRGNFSEQINKKLWDGLNIKEGGEEMADRRIFERFPAQFSLRLVDRLRDSSGEAVTYNISAKGLGVMTKEQMERNTPVEMWLSVPDEGEPLYSRGSVVYSRLIGINQYRTGIDLEQVDFMGMARLLRNA